ncbi:type IV pilin protein [Roseateles sp. DB2]|uniref:type IV pilin protein n=1 Tax=Roseateles sp. DB2 TaxID=3453717 RepID=UPI003EEAB20A
MQVPQQDLPCVSTHRAALLLRDLHSPDPRSASSSYAKPNCTGSIYAGPNCASRPPALSPHAGLSLLELMIALLITATLATLTWPRFETFLHKARRSEAQTALAEVLTAQSRYRSTHRRYAGSLAELGLAASPLMHYQLRLLDLPKSTDGDDDADAEPFSKGFVALAVPLRTSTQARDQACAELRLTLQGRQLTHSASDSGGSPNPQCWPQ